MLKLYVYRSAWDLLSISPYCVHAEVWLRIAGIQYEREVTGTGGSPRGVLPWAEVDGGKLSDPHEVRAWLKEHTHALFHATRTPAELATLHAVGRMIEHSLYWAFVHARWADPDGYAAIKPTMVGFAPPGLGSMMVPIFRRTVLSLIAHSPMAARDSDSIYAEGIADLRSLAALLGDNEWFCSEHATDLDAHVYSVLGNILHQPGESPLARETRATPQLVAFCERVESRFLQD